MKRNSDIFESIRVKPDEDRLLRAKKPACEWPGCSQAGVHKAPKGRGHDGEYHQFCLEHVREYNKSYNYFAGMEDGDIADYQKASVTGHRPTWRLGVNSWANHCGERSPGHSAAHHDANRFADPFELFGDGAAAEARARRPVRNAERRALSTLGLDETADASGIKNQYKLLVKRHHPDANGGRRDSEEKLREIIQAYNYLKSVGFC